MKKSIFILSFMAFALTATAQIEGGDDGFTQKPGTQAKLTILRDGKEKEVTVTVAENPEDSVSPNEAKQTQGKLGVSVRALSEEELKELPVEE